MATRTETVELLLERLAGVGSIHARKMFGEFALYRNGSIFALVCDDRLFLKPTTAGTAFASGLGRAPPYPGAKPHLLVDGERWDDVDWLVELVRITIAALPAPARGKRGRKTERPDP